MDQLVLWLDQSATAGTWNTYTNRPQVKTSFTAAVPFYVQTDDRIRSLRTSMQGKQATWRGVGR